jgi:hypothetical protein
MNPSTAESRLALELILEAAMSGATTPQEAARKIVRALDHRDLLQAMLDYVDGRHDILQALPHLEL